MFKKCFPILLLFLYCAAGDACTAFRFSSPDKPIMGKSYDWYQSHGFVTVNKRQVSKTALKIPFENPVSWVSKYGSVTFNQYGREFPLGGYNEQGLGIEILWLGETKYPEKDARQSINELQWIQYQLDNFGSVSEVVQNVENIRLKNILADVHYFVCDRFSECATVEYLNGRAVIHSGAYLPYGVITNNTYSESLLFLKQHNGFGGKLPIPQSRASLDRFVRAAHYLQKESSSFQSAFATLSSVQQGGYSVWNITYDLKNALLAFRTSSYTAVREFNVRSFDFSCKKPVLTLNMQKPLSGDVTHLFTEYDPEENRKMIEDSFEPTPLKQFLAPEMADYPESTVCLEN